MRQRTNAVLGAGERGKPCGTTHTRGGAGEQDRSPLSFGHALGHFSGIEKTGETGHFPDLEILAGRFFKNAAWHIGADVEDERFDGADLVFNLLDQCHHIFFFARIASEAMGFATVGEDGIDQWLEFVCAAACDAGDESFLGETLGNGAAGGVSGTHNQYDLLVIHGRILLLNDR
ncbi:hypothetical protein D3C71_1696800 [compost metagenome]